MTDSTDSDLLDDWTPYDQFAEERYQQHSVMLEQFELGPGPGPPHFDSFPEFPEFFPPPPPIPGSIEECETFSSHFQHCDISKVENWLKISLKSEVKSCEFAKLSKTMNYFCHSSLSYKK